MNLASETIGLDCENIIAVYSGCILFNNIKMYFAARKHMLSRQSECSVKRGCYELYVIRDTAHLCTGGGGVTIHFHSDSVYY